MSDRTDTHSSKRSLTREGVVRAASTQATWTGDEESMIVKHEGFVRVAAGAQIICF
jgi:N-carbamoylputrescine amidase